MSGGPLEAEAFSGAGLEAEIAACARELVQYACLFPGIGTDGLGLEFVQQARALLPERVDQGRELLFTQQFPVLGEQFRTQEPFSIVW